MASTNKTSHYELSQYVGTDKPTYLTDYNNDMSAIDTGIYNAQVKADSAYTAAGLADGKAGDAQTTANTAVTSAGTANTNIGTMANLTTTEKSTLVGAINEVEGNIEKFNFTSFTPYNAGNTTCNNCSITAGSITVATNSDGSIGKIYSDVNIMPTSNTCSIVMNTSLRPTSNISIGACGYARNNTTGYMNNCYMNISTAGVVSLEINANTGVEHNVLYFPCLYFMKDFGDQPNA